MNPTKTLPPTAPTVTLPTVKANKDTPENNTRHIKATYDDNPSNNTIIRKDFRQNTKEKILATFNIGKHTTSAHTIARHQYPKEVLDAVLN